MCSYNHLETWSQFLQILTPNFLWMRLWAWNYCCRCIRASSLCFWRITVCLTASPLLMGIPWWSSNGHGYDFCFFLGIETQCVLTAVYCLICVMQCWRIWILFCPGPVSRPLMRVCHTASPLSLWASLGGRQIRMDSVSSSFCELVSYGI